jgi:hydroxyethylthiazole kinase-like uncharacterized protein yjeF
MFAGRGYDVLTVEEIVRLERRIEADGVSLLELMKKAGASVSDHLLHSLDPAVDEVIVVLCGSGNNGGDGWVIAGNLAERGYPVVLVTARPAAELSVEPARSAALETVALDAAALTIMIDPSKDELAALLQEAQVVVDALLGIGFNGVSIREPYRTWIELLDVSQSRQPALRVIAVDIPSGLSADTGEAASPCVTADTTITMLAAKPGLLAKTAERYRGTLLVAPLI